MAKSVAHDKIYRKLEKRLFAIISKLRGEFESLPDGQSGGDVIDVAFNAIGGDISSSLLHLESKEMKQIKKAMDLIENGKYGVCESCETKIPAARLEALPYSILCINCQRRRERNGDDSLPSDWNKRLTDDSDDSDDPPTVQVHKS